MVELCSFCCIFFLKTFSAGLHLWNYLFELYLLWEVQKNECKQEGPPFPGKLVNLFIYGYPEPRLWGTDGNQIPKKICTWKDHQKKRHINRKELFAVYQTICLGKKIDASSIRQPCSISGVKLKQNLYRCCSWQIAFKLWQANYGYR